MDRILKIGLIFAFLLLSVKEAQAYTIPTFPSCVNPQGTLRVHYASGVHGIPGESGVYNGEDKVYALSDISLLQCFCPGDGAGIETRWWKVSQLTAEELKYLQSQGWVLIPDGSLWGLDKSEYMAKNLSYSCKGGNGGASNSSSGQVASATNGIGGGQVLGLATTGAKWQPYVLLVVGIVGLGIAFSGGKDKRTEK